MAVKVGQICPPLKPQSRHALAIKQLKLLALAADLFRSARPIACPEMPTFVRSQRGRIWPLLAALCSNKGPAGSDPGRAVVLQQSLRWQPPYTRLRLLRRSTDTRKPLRIRPVSTGCHVIAGHTLLPEAAQWPAVQLAEDELG